MLCPKCGAQLSDSAVICRACGAMLPERPAATQVPYPPASQPAETAASTQPNAPRTCAQCGAPLEDGVRFCTNCGAPVPEQPASADPAQSVPPQQDTANASYTGAAAPFGPGICPRCGSRLAPGARFCTVCGMPAPEAPQGQADWYAPAPGGTVSSPEIGPKHKPKKLLIGLLCAFIAGGIASLIFSFLTITLRTNQNVTGLTLTILGSGVGNFFGGSLNKLAGGVGQVSVAVTSQAFRNYSLSLVNFFDGFTGKLRLGTLLFSYGFLTYVAIILAVAIWFFLSKTRTGLSLRAIGENTATADAAGINVTKYKYLATCIGAGISGLGGTYYVMNYIKGTWENQGTIEALGWLAVALVIFATWKSLRAIWGSYLFGVLYWAYNYIPGLSRSTLELFKMLPYVVTILVLLMVSMRKKKEDQPPQSLGIPYFREER